MWLHIFFIKFSYQTAVVLVNHSKFLFLFSFVWYCISPFFITGSVDRSGGGHWRWCHPRRAGIRRFCASESDSPPGCRWTACDPIPEQAAHAPWICFQQLGRFRHGAADQREALLRRQRHHAGEILVIVVVGGVHCGQVFLECISYPSLRVNVALDELKQCRVRVFLCTICGSKVNDLLCTDCYCTFKEAVSFT